MKKVLIIGGGSGIGYEIAKTLNSNNYDVTCVGRKGRNNFEFNYIIMNNKYLYFNFSTNSLNLSPFSSKFLKNP